VARRVIPSPVGPLVQYDRWVERPALLPSLHASEVKALTFGGKKWGPAQHLRDVLMVQAVFPGARVTEHVDWEAVIVRQERALKRQPAWRRGKIRAEA